MSQLKDIRIQLAVNAATCTGIKQAYGRVLPDITSTPAVVIRPLRFPIAETFEGATTYYLTARVMVSIGDYDNAQDTLDDLLETTGPGSLIVALESDLDLSGEAHSVRVVEVDEYGIEEVGGVQLLGASLLVEVMA